MARKDDPEDLNPYPGDPWHPAWVPEEPEVGENDVDMPTDESSVERVYEALRSLGDDDVDAEEPEAPGVVADVGPLQTSGSGGEPAADIAVAWDTTNVEEERRREAAAATFAGQDLRSVASDLAADVDESELSATAQESARREEQVEEAERDWVHGEMTTLEHDLAEHEAEGLIAQDAAEAVRSSDQIEIAGSNEAAEVARGAESTYAEFEELRRGAEAETEETRLRAGFEEAEGEWVQEEMTALELELDETSSVQAGQALAEEAARGTEQIESAAAGEAGEAARTLESSYTEFENFRESVELEGEETRRVSGIEAAETEDFDDRMRAVEADLAAAEDEAVAEDEARHTQRSLAEGDQILGAEAGDAAADFASGLAVDLAGADESVAGDEASRAESQIELAEAGEFAESMEATQLDLGDDLDATEAVESADEDARFQEQLVDAVVVEQELAEASASERMAAVEQRLRFSADIDERFALDAELARVEAAALAHLRAESIGDEGSIPDDPEEPAVPAKPSRFGWLRSVFGGRGREPVTVEQPERVGSGDSLVDGDEPLPDDAVLAEVEEELEEQPVAEDEVAAETDVELEGEPETGESFELEGDEQPEPEDEDEIAAEDGVDAEFVAEEEFEFEAAEDVEKDAVQEEPLTLVAEAVGDGDVVAADDEEAVFTGVEVDVTFAGAFEPSEVDDEIPDFAAFTSEHYIQSSTEEYAGLAEAVARAAEEDSGELAAIAAPIPGLDTGVVGLEDVVVDDVVDQTGPELPRRSNLALRVLTALGLFGVFLGSLVFEVTVGLLVLVILLIGASELYTVLIRRGYRPIALFGFVGIISAQVGTWIWGVGAVPVAVTVTLAATALLVGVAPARHNNLENLALTVLVMIWIGGLGAFAFAMISAPHFRWLIGAVVVTTALMDVAQFFVGRRIGKHRLTRVSPNKTVEGLVGGLIVAVLVGIGFGFYRPFDLASGLALGAVVAVVAPFGDLAVSVMKRSIGVKDMGSVLPGHGGVLDRIDALIFVLPAAWIVFRAAGLLG